MILGTEDISISKKEVKESRLASINTTKTLIFKHEASAGDILIDTTALVTPSDAASRGFTQPNLAEVSELQLLVNKKNLKIHSSRGIWLQMYEDFLVTGQHTIQLVGNIADLGGALEGEVFTVYATPIQANSILTTDAKKMYQEYTLADGDSVLNLGREYAVNTNPLGQVGSIRIFRNGQGPLLRNVGNATANPSADGNFQEIDAGNGIGTTIEFNSPATGQDDTVVVEFGLEYAGDLSIVGDMQALYGGFKKLIEDAAPAFGWEESRYLAFNPSEIERRGFGDAVIDHERRILSIEDKNSTPVVCYYTNAAGQSIPNTIFTLVDFQPSGKIEDTHNAMSAGIFTAPKKRRYLLNASIRYNANSNGTRSLYAYSTGTLSTGYHGLQVAPGQSPIQASLTGSRVFSLDVGQTLRIVTVQDSGGALSLINSSDWVSINIVEIGEWV